MTIAKEAFQPYYASMQLTMQKNKYTASELALLAIFAVSLVFAGILTAWRNRIPMSEPVILDFAGITVSVPQGGKWLALKRWGYNKKYNNFVLASTIVQDKVHAAFAELTYIFTPETPDPVEYINNHLASGADITDEGVILRDGVELFWRQVKPSELNAVVYVAAARLTADRLLHIKVFAYRNVVSAEKVFMSVTKTLRFDRNEQLEQGIQFVRHLKDKQIPQLIRNETGPSMNRIYLINRTEDVEEEIQRQRIFDGFVVEHFKINYRNEYQPVECTSFFLMGDPKGGRADTFFQSDLTFDTFAWKSKRATFDGDVAGIIQIELDKHGILSYINLYAEPERNIVHPGPLAIPEILLDAVATELLDYPGEAVIVDIIFSDGRIIPTRISKITPADLNASLKDIAFAVKVQFLHHVDSLQIIYFDRNRDIIAKLEGAKATVVGYRSSSADLLNAFEEWTEHIEKILK